MINLISAATLLPTLRFRCVNCGAGWTAEAGDYTRTPGYEGDAPAGTYDAVNHGILTTCACPVCGVQAAHGIIYQGAKGAQETAGSAQNARSAKVVDIGLDISIDEDGGEPVDTMSTQLEFNISRGRSATLVDSGITPQMVVAALQAPEGVQSGEWTFDTDNGQCILTGDILRDARITVVFTQASVQEVDIAENEEERTLTADVPGVFWWNSSTETINVYADIPAGTYDRVMLRITGAQDDLHEEKSFIRIASIGNRNGWTLRNNTAYVMDLDAAAATVTIHDITAEAGGRKIAFFVDLGGFPVQGAFPGVVPRPSFEEPTYEPATGETTGDTSVVVQTISKGGMTASKG